MNLNEANAKMQAEKAYYANNLNQAQAGVCPAPSAYYGDCCAASEPFTLRGEAEQKVSYHRTQAEKADQAAAFFRENPAFDEFIRLIRNGSIQI
jgi:hypothetical protein